MNNSWELDGSLLAKIDEYFQSEPTRPLSESVGSTWSMGRGKRARIIDSPTEELGDPVSGDSDGNCSDGEYQPECVVCNEPFDECTYIGVPMSCIHVFCYACIKEWSKRANVCPICKCEFVVLRRLQWKLFVDYLSSCRLSLQSITVKRRPQIKSYKSLRERLVNCLASVKSDVETVAQKSLTEEAEEPIGGCEVCGNDDDWDRLLLCDGCNLGFHIFCLDPPLEQIPLEDWFCKACSEGQTSRREATDSTLNTRRSRTRTRSARMSSRRPSYGGTSGREECILSDTSARNDHVREADNGGSLFEEGESSRQEITHHSLFSEPNTESSDLAEGLFDMDDIIQIVEEHALNENDGIGNTSYNNSHRTSSSGRSQYDNRSSVTSTSTLGQSVSFFGGNYSSGVSTSYTYTCSLYDRPQRPQNATNFSEHSYQGGSARSSHSTSTSTSNSNNPSSNRIGNHRTASQAREPESNFRGTAYSRDQLFTPRPVSPTNRQNDSMASVLDGISLDRIDELCEERTRRQASFIYHYKRLMEQHGYGR